MEFARHCDLDLQDYDYGGVIRRSGCGMDFVSNLI
jgi:hypothetical protein